MATPFAQRQRRQQIRWLRHLSDLPPESKTGGRWQHIPHVPFILPMAFAELTLWEPIRAQVLAHFANSDIAWHDGELDDARASESYGPRPRSGPSPHLLDSQVACINFWWGLATIPGGLELALAPVLPPGADIEAPAVPGVLVEPEWMGLDNPLGEREGRRRRGSWATSADLLVVYRDPHGHRHGLMIESKYTESYRALPPRTRGRDRIYRPHFEAHDAPFLPDLPFDMSALLVDPFDQLTRQLLLARAMERTGELGMATVRQVLAAPSGNDSLLKVLTVPALQGRGESVPEAWASLLREPHRFHFLTYEDCFRRVAAASLPGAAPWTRYHADRYAWADLDRE